MDISRTRKNHPAGFKAKVALSTLRKETPVSELALKYGVHATVINRWKKEAIASMEAGFAGKLEKVSADKEAQIHKLHAKIGQ
ncbi:MAG: transposase [Alphaproteobacteria bacterium]|nr:transposase [Alphaproteobacteria bacterium]MCK5659104.1 transposase [Alphaproteobacteria bacterium]